MKKNLTKMMALALAGSMLLPVTALAAPKQMSDGSYFDAEYYAAANPDVYVAFGNNEALLWQHFQMFGRNEGRLPVNPNAEKNVLALDVSSRILALKTAFPEGTYWTGTSHVYHNDGIWPFYGMGCSAFTMQMSDAIYGTQTPVRFYYNLTANDLQPGDVVRTNYGTHSVMVISTDATSVTVCEANYNKSVHWGRVIPKSAFQITYVARRG